jgi:predicted ATPase
MYCYCESNREGGALLWQISDFKGIESAQLDIRPGKATILTGINSSGKSSTLQSLLLAAQSLYNEGPIVLNGPLVRLGDAQDLVREASSTGHIGIRLSVDTHFVDGALHDAPLTAEFQLVATEDRSSLRAKRITFASTNFPGQALELARANSRGSDVERALNATAYIGPREVLHVKSLLGSDNRQLRTYAVMQGLRPIGLVQLIAPGRVAGLYRDEFESMLSEGSRKLHGSPRSGITPQVAREFYGLLSEADPDNEEIRDLSKRFGPARSGNPFRFDSIWGELTIAERTQAIDVAASVRARRAYSFLPLKGSVWGHGSVAIGLLESALGTTLGASYDALSALGDSLDELGRRVQYLGPLRDEPRVVWNLWNELAKGLPVGTRGEFSAAVLSRSANDGVRYCPPGETERTVDRLSTAVNQWLEYLQIGDRINARSRGKLGVGFELHLDGHVRDLTSVGVGVSQALPLLVGLLSAPENSVFIVEQPELHLHPAVQARLADFMLLARPDVTLIVETHSESFITRIRRRAAEGIISTSDVDITFVESHGGGATTRTLQLSEFGDLDEWPEGFLSSTEEDIRAILQMNIKRARGATGD